MKTNDQIRQKNLEAAKKQADFWRKQISANQDLLAELSAKKDAALDRGQELASRLAEAEEYVLDLQEAENDA